MTTPYKIAVLVGSLRAESLNRKMAEVLIDLAPETLDLEIVEIGDLPIYNPDLDGEDPPSPWRRFRDEMRQVQGVLFLTPEYNRSIPAVIKNAIDVGSRPYGSSIWAKKPGAVASLSPGKLGAFGANHHLRQAMVFLNVPIMQQPEAYIGGAAKLFDDQGDLADESTRDFMTTFINSYADWVRTHLRD